MFCLKERLEAIYLREKILDLLAKNPILTPLLENKKERFVVDDSVGISLLFSALFKRKPGRYLILTNNLYNAQQISNTIASLIGDEYVHLYPNDDVLRSELISASKEFLAQRLFVLNETLKGGNAIYVAHSSSIMTPLPTKAEFQNSTLKIKYGDKLDIKKLKETLIRSGYICVNKIDQSLEFASRGDILDIYPINCNKPVRIELFDDEVEAIRSFEISTQTSIAELDEVEISPANDCLVTDEELLEFKKNVAIQLEKDLSLLDKDTGDLLKQSVEFDYEKISERIYSPKTYKYYRYLKKHIGSLVDYIEPNLIFVVNERQFTTSTQFLIKESREYLYSLFEQGKILSHQEMYLDLEDIFVGQHVFTSLPNQMSSKDKVFNVRPVVFSKTSLSNINIIIDSYLSTSEKVVLALSNKQQYDTIKTNLEECHIEFEELNSLEVPNGQVGITLFHLDEGFELEEYKISCISSKELFGYHSHSSRFFSRFKEAQIIKNYEDLKIGDYVVHENYGIGKYLGIKTIEINGTHTDFLHIQYAGTDVIYIPLSQFRMVRKYSGREGVAPKLSNPNGKSWEKTKAKIKERINDLADRLFKLYSERSLIEGYAFPKDDELQRAFEAEFPFELTEDQKQAVQEIKHDMEAPIAMDRLLCGDVGFGKTEVAFEVIFKALLAGKQAAILCPTTLLAKQHFDRALERFSNYGVKIAILSRLVPEKDQKDYLTRIASGDINLIIGTHRLLSKEVVFHDLGLLIIDEEQRFGVEQKEKIKEISKNIDVLSLSATPIPRTLQLSLIGVRPVSQIQTAPSTRNSIQTYVTPYKFEIAKELMERELSRHGQVFYVYNRVETIFNVANHIASAIPSAVVGVIHGKMDREEADDTMNKFSEGKIDILVATSIIENGIDIPNANLILVEDADHFGLAQLYQIKGRVGRSNRIAYAYLFYRETKVLSDVATKRLKAIQDFAELGSGYKIAQRDLMIRGAGDILGPEQAGFIDSIGLDLYLKLLNEVIEEKKTGTPTEPPKPMKMFSIDAYIPEGYASDEEKIQLYQEIDGAKTQQELKEIKKKIRDIYGRLPDEVKLLIDRKRVDILVKNEEIKDVLEYPDNVAIILSKKFSAINGIGMELFDAIQEYMDVIKVSFINKELKITILKKNNWFLTLETILDVVHKLYLKRKNKSNED